MACVQSTVWLRQHAPDLRCILHPHADWRAACIGTHTSLGALFCDCGMPALELGATIMDIEQLPKIRYDIYRAYAFYVAYVILAT